MVPTPLISTAPASHGTLDRDTLIRAYRLTQNLRAAWTTAKCLLKRQSKIFFQVSGAGHEAYTSGGGHGVEAGQRLGRARITATGHWRSRWG